MRQMIATLVTGALCLGCDQSAPNEGDKAPRPPTQTTAPLQTKNTSDEKSDTTKVNLAGVGAFQTAPQLSDTISQIISISDSNRDGQITKQEATGALNFVVGGFFFRADLDGDGSITAAERQSLKADFTQEHPAVYQLLSSFVESPTVKLLSDQLDVDTKQTVELSRARSTIQDAVDGLYAKLDTNQDDTITPLEMDQGFNVAAAELGKVAFAQADGNNDEQVEFEEFLAILRDPLKRVFDSVDHDNDGKLTEKEAASSMWWMTQRLDAMTERAYDTVAEATSASTAQR